MGELAILNVGAGDTKLVFDNSDPDEVAKSAAIVTDMIRKGFVLLIEVGRDDKGAVYRRCQGFDPATCEYVVAGPVAPEESNVEESPVKTPRGRKAAKRQTSRVPAAGTRAVAVARTAGG